MSDRINCIRHGDMPGVCSKCYSLMSADITRLREELAAAKADRDRIQQMVFNSANELRDLENLRLTNIGDLQKQRDEARAKLAAMEKDMDAKENTRDQLSLSLNNALKEKFRMEKANEVLASFAFRCSSAIEGRYMCGGAVCELCLGLEKEGRILFPLMPKDTGHKITEASAQVIRASLTPSPRPTEGKPDPYKHIKAAADKLIADGHAHEPKAEEEI